MKADFDTKRLEQAAEEARKKLNKTLSEDAPLPEGAPLSAKTAKKGLNVFVVSLGKNGVITDVNGNDVTVQVGILKMTVPAKKCLLTKHSLRIPSCAKEAQGLQQECCCQLRTPDVHCQIRQCQTGN